MDIGIVGAPNRGKSTFFAAATLSKAEIASYPFTTIKPNTAMGYVTAKCPCSGLGVKCNPNNSKCINGTRFIPIKLIDVAGLVPGAHEGRGLGNQFLDDLRQAQALIQIIDLSGGTDEEGKIVDPGTYDPSKDVVFLEEEIDYWVFGIVKKQWEKVSRRIQYQHENIYHFLAGQLSGIGISESAIRVAISKLGTDPERPANWSQDDLWEFTKLCRSLAKPMVIAGNKIDLPKAEENMDKIKRDFPEKIIFPCSAESELALRRAAEKKLIDYMPGSDGFEIIGDIDEKQKKALETIKENVLGKYGSTGIQQIINSAVFDLLKLIVVYPVEDENKLSDKNGNILPDAYLVPEGSTALDLAHKIHTDIGENFVAAIDAKTKRKLGKDSPLKNGDIVKIATKTK